MAIGIFGTIQLPKTGTYLKIIVAGNGMQLTFEEKCVSRVVNIGWRK